MNSVDAVLLVGNGPNRISSDESSWWSVLAKLADWAGGQVATGSKPLPLVFEEIVFRHILGSMTVISKRYLPSIESDLRSYVSDLVGKMRPNGVHYRILAIGFRHILTTNYDYCLEQAATHSREPWSAALLNNQVVDEKKYSLFRRHQVSTTRGPTFVWHIHGESHVPRSLVLGYDQYVSYLGRVTSYLTHTADPRRSGSDLIPSAVLSGDKQFEDSGRAYSWLDLFLQRDVYILGLSLDYSEIILWWLLNCKTRLRIRERMRSANTSLGHTVFYSLSSEDTTNEEKSRLDLLEAMGVEVIRLGADRGYVHAYHMALSDIKRRVRR